MNRRHFFCSGAAALAAVPLQARFAERTGPARLQLSLAAYSFRDRFAFLKGRAQEVDGEAMDMFTFLDYCAEHDCGAELTSYFFPPEPADDYLRRIKRHAFLRAVPICGTAIGNDFSHGDGERLESEIAAAREWLRRAAVLGAPHVRFFAGTSRGFAQSEERYRQAVAALRACARTAAAQGVFIGIENHGGITADFLLRLVREVDSPWVGINLDSGNFVSDDPYGDFARCAPLAVNVQLKTHVKRGVEADLPRLIKSLQEVRYQGHVVLEYESGDAEGEIPGYLDRLRALM